VQRIHLETRRKINLCSDELNGGPFSHRLIFCWKKAIDRNYRTNSFWEIRIDPIIRVFVKLRQTLLDNEDLRKELDELRQLSEERFQIVFETLDQLLSVESKPKKIYPVKFEDHLTWEIGFMVKEKVSKYGLKN
jgi:hypothetical protein